ncbi:hypothetical protein H4R34_001329 [Dimargaris verticillata]|uniref:Hyaluronan/mRNA-binding protein domain-containing protein n=1 Tax=Dimargaris verticillata TaxID=2761393 RepID=A0A9W8B4M9_9FUNG|nr:hypothetical protein H4R34_001329 [Dimargaris verticillata]
MSLASNNPFALLSEDGRKSTAGGSAGAQKPKPSASKPATTTSTSTSRAGAEASARPRRDPSTRVIQPSELLAAEPSTSGRSGRGARGGRGGRGRGRDRDALDRRSRTGLHDSAKKIDQGWGKPVESSLKAGEEKADAPKKEGEEGTDAAPKAEGEEAVAAEATPEEPEDKTMTLEEYRKAKAASDNLAAQPLRKPNTEGQNEWENAVLLDRDQEEYSTGKGTGKSGRSKSQKVKTQIAIEQRFQAPRRGGFRDDKSQGGAGRGGRGRGGNRSNINVQDERAFPSLGA